MSEISVGIIGAGMMGQEHIQNFNLLEGAQVTALADTNAAMLAKAAEMADGTPSQSDDFETLLGDNGPDVLVIATPNFHHINVLESALEAGKPIFMRKAALHDTGRYTKSHAARRASRTGFSSRHGISLQARPERDDLSRAWRRYRPNPNAVHSRASLSFSAQSRGLEPL